MKLYIDDIRQCPEGWQIARTVTEAIRFIHRFKEEITHISIDHDICYEINGVTISSPETFAPVAMYLAIMVKEDIDRRIPNIVVHSANPIGAREIQDILKESNVYAEYIPVRGMLKKPLLTDSDRGVYKI